MLEDFIRKIKKNLESNPNIIGKEKKVHECVSIHSSY